MADINMKLIEQVARKVGKKASDVDDIIYALCIAERIYHKTVSPDGQNKLDYKQVVKTGYGFNLRVPSSITDVSDLPDIRCRRLECDVLYILTEGKVDGTELTMPTSAKIIPYKHSTFDYENDISVCEAYIGEYRELIEGTISFNILTRVENTIDAFVKKYNVPKLYEVIKDGLYKSICLPEKYAKDHPLVTARGSEVPTDSCAFSAFVVDNVCFSLEKFCYEYLNELYTKNNVRATMLLNDILKLDVSVGTFSNTKYSNTPKINFSGFPYNIQSNKVDKIFNPRVAFTEDDLNFLLSFVVSVLVKKHITEVYYEA